MEAKNQEPCSSAMRPAWSTLWRLFWLSLWMFSLFGVAASVVRLSLTYLSPHDSGDVVISGLWMRVILFSVGTVVLGGGLWRWRHVQRDIPVAILPSDDCRGSKSLIPYAGLVLGMVFAAVLVFPRLDAWPWAAPDEIYHLTVAKNLALYGEYASGGPETGFKRFDPYDSVGAPVIVPIAAVFRCVGVSVAAGRCVIGVYLLLLSVGAFFLAWRTFGPGAAVMAVLLTPAAFSTIYLARALYGEVPALAWWVWGLLCWRRAVEKPGDIRVGLLAGLAFGLAVLCKSIFVMSAFAFVAVWFWDRMGPRRIPLSAMFFPAVGVAGCIAAWWGVQTLGQGDVAQGAGDTVGVYQYHLLFGIQSVPESFLRWWNDYPFSHWVSLVALFWVVPIVFGRRYEPASMALFLTAAFFGLWWIFFTPGRLPRYYWMGNWAMAWFTAPLWVACLCEVWRGERMVVRAVAVLGLVLLAVTPVQWVWNQGREVFCSAEMREDTALAALAARVPRETVIAVTFAPLRETLDFYTGRRLPVVSGQPDPLVQYPVVAGLLGDRTATSGYRIVVGRYAIWSREPLPSLVAR